MRHRSSSAPASISSLFLTVLFLTLPACGFRPYAGATVEDASQNHDASSDGTGSNVDAQRDNQFVADLVPLADLGGTDRSLLDSSEPSAVDGPQARIDSLHRGEDGVTPGPDAPLDGSASPDVAPPDSGGPADMSRPIDAAVPPDTAAPVDASTADAAQDLSSKLPSGSTCASGDQCDNGICSPDHVCCNRACTGSCEACDLSSSRGTCAAVPSGQPHGKPPCGNGECGGFCSTASVECTYPTSPCGLATCDANKLTRKGSCNGGTCLPGPMQDCGAYGCNPDATSCPTACISSADCHPDYFCSDGKCVSDVVKVATSLFHTCAILKNGKLTCWGSNGAGELGTGEVGPGELHPIEVKGLPAISDIALGNGFSCVLTSDARVLCWGGNAQGNLGDGTRSRRLTPTPVKAASGGGDLTGVSAIGTGICHTCVLTSSGIQCWGCNKDGQLARPPAGVDDASDIAQVIAGTASATSLSVGHGNVYFQSGPSDWCGWGSNYFKQLSLSDPSVVVYTPPSCQSRPSYLEYFVGSPYVCARGNYGGVDCWGMNGGGETPATNLGGGSAHVCARLLDGHAECWGANVEGELGDGTFDNSAMPRAVTDAQGNPIGGVAKSGLSRGGAKHTCAIFDDGSLSCWGYNSDGQLGIGRLSMGVEEGVAHATPVKWNGN